MPRLEYFVVSESVSIDKNRNTVSIFHVMNKIGLSPLPGAIPMLSAISGWEFSETELKDKAEFQVKFEFRTPGSTEPKIFRSNLNSSVRFKNVHLEIQEVPIEQAGDLKVTLYLDDVSQATHTIQIVDLPA